MDSCYLIIIQIENYSAVARFRFIQRQLKIEKRPHQAIVGPLLVVILIHIFELYIILALVSLSFNFIGLVLPPLYTHRVEFVELNANFF